MSRRPRERSAKARSRTAGDLPDDDRALWQHTAASVEPLRRAKPRVPDVEPSASEASSRREQPARSAALPGAGREQRVDRSSDSAPTRSLSPSRTEPPPLAAFERRKARRIASGQIEIDARIDLHGLRQNEAHHRLIGFLTSCVARGFTTVLVITGKGARNGEDDHRLDMLDDRPARGVLRRSVPLWLAEPALRAIVTSYTSAAIKHGGEGAFYVRLRRRGRHQTGD